MGSGISTGAPLPCAPSRERPPSLDVAALEERGREIKRLSRLYSALSQVNQAIVSTPTRDELFLKVCRVLVEQGGFGMTWIGWHVPATHRLAPVATWGDDTGYVRSIQVYTDERPEGLGPSGTAFREAKPYICNDMLEDPATLPWRSEYELRGFRASAVFPIREDGKVQGTLSVYAHEAGFFKEEEVALLSEVAGDISFGLANLAREAARRRAEHTLQKERDFSEAVLSSLPGVFYLYDRGGRFLRWNDNFERVTGYTGAEIKGMHPLDFFAEEDKEIVSSRIGEVFTHGEAHVEAEFISKDGRSTPYLFTGVSREIDGQTCLVGVGTDITKRRSAEEAMRISEGRYRALFEHAPDGILIADPDRYYIDANASMCQMLGRSREELIGLHASDIVAPAEVEHIAPALEVLAATANDNREWRLRRNDGSFFPAEVFATLLPDGNLLAMVRDVTERKRADRALRELNETLELKVAERTEELRAALVRAEAADQLKSAFLATMSHELRTPLNSIIGFTGLVLQGMAGPVNPEQVKQLGMVKGSARHLLELINDVLDLSKIEAQQLEVQREAFDLAASIERVLASVKPQADQKGLTLRAEVSPDLEQLVSDRRRVEQILLNLLNNAIKFTVQGGVTLTAEVVHARPPPEGPADPLPVVRLRVSDTGIGVRPQDLATLFQPFRQIDTGLARQHEGTGLGLAICRRLAALLGGEISAQSEPSKGSTFTLILPLQKTPPQ